MRREPIWKFWNPMSGFGGGCILVVVIGIAFIVGMGLMRVAHGADLKIPKAAFHYDSGVTYDATAPVKTLTPKPSLRQCLAQHHYVLRYCYGAR